MKSKTWLRLIPVLAFAASLAYAQQGVDPAIPAYTKVAGISGEISSIGSDTLNDLMTYWAEGFKKVYPGVRVQVEGKGSATAPAALIASTAQLGPMSREMQAQEIDEFEKKFGYKPTLIKVAIDALAIYVHKDCPLHQITLPEADAIFSTGRKAGFAKDLKTWGDLGMTDDWAARPLSLYGRNSASGTYVYFKDHVLKKGEFKDVVKEQPGSATVVQGIAADKLGMGYSGIGYRTSEVKPLALAAKAGDPFITPDAENVYAGKYPLGRFLLIYVNKAPNKPMDPLTREFLRFVTSKEGQELVVKGGYLPLRTKELESMKGTLATTKSD